MTRDEFFFRLREGLSKLPPEEAENAVRYYTEYFDDAGVENEPRVLQELGDPTKIAQQVVAESMVRDIVAYVPHPKEQGAPKKNTSGIGAVWIVILAAFAAPIGLPVAIAIAVVAFSLVVVAASVLLALFATSIALMVSGVFTFFIGCSVLTVHLPTSVFSIGAGLAVAGVGLLLFLPEIWLAKAMFTGIARLIGRCVIKKGAEI